MIDDKGKVVGEVPGSGRILAGMIQQRNQNIQKKYSIGKPVFLDVPKHQDFGKMKSKFLEWVLKTDKEDHKKMVKENMKPFETLFFGVGAEILKNVKGFMAANPKKSVQNIRKKLKTSIENVKASGDKKKLNTLKLQLDKLNKIGGVDAIVPSEGLVFKYKGKTYKFTGAFAPINQITGLLSF